MENTELGQVLFIWGIWALVAGLPALLVSPKDGFPFVLGFPAPFIIWAGFITPIDWPVVVAGASGLGLALLIGTLTEGNEGTRHASSTIEAPIKTEDRMAPPTPADGPATSAAEPDPTPRATATSAAEPDPTPQGSPTGTKMPDAIRVGIFLPQDLFRRGFEMVLEGEPDIDVVGEASDGQSAVEQARSLAPDVALLDIRMPKLSGVEATRTIRREQPHTKVLMLTFSDDEPDLYEAIIAGASGYLLLEISIEEIATAIRALSTGASFISPSIAVKILTDFAQLSQPPADNGARLATLTNRETEELKRLAQGMSDSDIALELSLTPEEVKKDVTAILEKLRLNLVLNPPLRRSSRGL